MKSQKLKPKHRLTARRLLADLTGQTNVFLLKFMNDILSLLNMLTLSFQSGKSSLTTSLEILESVSLELTKRKDKYSESHITSLISDRDLDQATSSEIADSHRPKRKKTLSVYLSDSIVTERLPAYHKSSGVTELRALAIDVIDSLLSELAGRFSDANTGIWASFANLLPTDESTEENFLDPEVLLPLLKYCWSIPYFATALKEADIPDIQSAQQRLLSESQVFKRIIISKFSKRRKDYHLKDGDVVSKIFKYVEDQDGIIVLKLLYKSAVVAGYSTSTVENAFSARNRVDTDCRRRLSPYKQGDLTLLHFEKVLLSEINFDEFVDIWKQSNRRLNL